jgi:hypothetical protein
LTRCGFFCIIILEINKGGAVPLQLQMKDFKTQIYFDELSPKMQNWIIKQLKAEGRKYNYNDDDCIGELTISED